MIITSNTLGELGNSGKLAQVGPFETDLRIPPEIQPIIALRNTVRGVNPNAADVQPTSTLVEFNYLVANAAASIVNFLSLANGTWELDFHLMYSSNYASGGAGFFLQVSIAGSNVNLLKAFTEQAGATYFITRKIQIQADTNMVFTGNLGANGAGNSHRAHIACLANRLL